MRGGFGSKVHSVTDGHGLPLGFCLSPGQSAEIKYATTALAMVSIPTPSGRHRTRPAHLAADKAYSSRAFRAEIREAKGVSHEQAVELASKFQGTQNRTAKVEQVTV